MTRNLFRGLDDKVAPRPVAEIKQPAPGPTVPAAPRQASRQGKKIVTYYLEPEPFVQLKVLAAKSGRTVQELNLEALNLLFEKHQVSRIAG
jgi:hypothetical protein